MWRSHRPPPKDIHSSGINQSRDNPLVPNWHPMSNFLVHHIPFTTTIYNHLQNSRTIYVYCRMLPSTAWACEPRRIRYLHFPTKRYQFWKSIVFTTTGKIVTRFRRVRGKTLFQSNVSSLLQLYTFINTWNCMDQFLRLDLHFKILLNIIATFVNSVVKLFWQKPKYF